MYDEEYPPGTILPTQAALATSSASATPASTTNTSDPTSSIYPPSVASDNASGMFPQVRLADMDVSIGIPINDSGFAHTSSGSSHPQVRHKKASEAASTSGAYSIGRASRDEWVDQAKLNSLIGAESPQQLRGGANMQDGGSSRRSTDDTHIDLTAFEQASPMRDQTSTQAGQTVPNNGLFNMQGHFATQNASTQNLQNLGLPPGSGILSSSEFDLFAGLNTSHNHEESNGGANAGMGTDMGMGGFGVGQSDSNSAGMGFGFDISSFSFDLSQFTTLFSESPSGADSGKA